MDEVSLYSLVATVYAVLTLVLPASFALLCLALLLRPTSCLLSTCLCANGPQLAKIPPFTRTVVGGILAVTVPVLLQVLSPYTIAFLPDRIANRFELWRLVTPFWYGGGGLNLVFSLVMVYRSLSELEDGHFAQRLADMSASPPRSRSSGYRPLTSHRLVQPGPSSLSVSESSYVCPCVKGPVSGRD